MNKKIKNGITELVFILDRSGSMAGFEADTVGGFNSTLEKQRGQEGKAFVSTVLFDNESEVLHDRMDIEQVPLMSKKEYWVRGCTALYDAVGDAIHHIGNIHKYARPEDVPEHTVFVITTDGMENASRRYTAREIKAKIKRQTEKYGWEFIFLAANIDAAEAAKNMGIRQDRAANYRQTPTGICESFCVMDRAISRVRENRSEEMDLHDLFEREE